jgi:HEAT repeat protein
MAAARELGFFGDPRAVPPLIAALSDSDRSVREAIIQALGMLGDSQAIEPILTLMHQPQDIINYQVLSALQDLEAKQAIPLLIEALKMDTGWGEEIAYTLDFMDVDGWALQAMFANPESRQVIESANYAFEDDRVIAYWQRQLETLAEPGDAEQIKRILWILRSHPDKRLIQVLLKWLDNYPKDVVKILGGTGDPTVSGVIITQLNHPDVEVRREAAQALANFQDERVMLALIDLLPHEPGAAVRRDVVWALTNFQDERAVLALIDVLQHDPDTWTRASTARQLSCRGTAPAITALHEALADPEAEVRIAVIKALDILRDSTAIPLLESLRQTDTERLSNGDAVWVLAELAIRNLQNETSALRPLTTP